MAVFTQSGKVRPSLAQLSGQGSEDDVNALENFAQTARMAILTLFRAT
jgi:hypothetical protein